MRPMLTMLSPRTTAVTLTTLFVLACANDVTSAENTSTTTTTASSNEAALAAAKWGTNVTVTFANGKMRYRSNGLPNHARQAQYALPTGATRVPTAASAYAAADPSRTQSYDVQIPLTPTKAATPTSTSLGTIGVMISGAALFNPYEGDGVTVATASNFFVKNSAGENVAFLDTCNGHPTPFGMYHYHALPPCVTAAVDVANGPSHIIGIAFDGYPIYGDRDIDGKPITASQLDQCNGITSPTPEFPKGTYHYVLLVAANSTSSIRCFSGTVSAAVSSSMSMPMSMPMSTPGMSH